MSFDSESDNDFEVCRRGGCGSNSCGLAFDPPSIEKIILTLFDKFDFRVVMSDSRARGAVIMTTGLTLAGGLLGKHYGGKVGALVGGAIGGACGLGIVAVSLRDLWEDVKSKLWELFDIVYDYLAGMGIEDYKKAAQFIIGGQTGGASQLAMIVMETAGNILGKRILTSLTNA